MQYHKPKLIFNKLSKLLGFIILLIAFTSHAEAQRRDTVPVKRATVIPRVINRVVTEKKDTVKPTTQPNTNPSNRVISAKDTVPDRKAVINRDILNNRLGILTKYPDTLEIGAYSIVVEDYDKGGVWNQASKSYSQLNGIGRIKFNCPLTFTIWPGLWKGAVMKTVSLKVVDNNRVKENEISTRDAAALGIKTKAGEDVELVMPHFNDRAMDMSKYINDVKSPKGPEGIRVRFTDITASVEKAGAAKGLVLSGVANYPTDPAIPPVPLVLNISPGFQLEVSTISFSPNLDPLVNAKLVLPSSITQNSECAKGRLDLGSFRLTPTCEFYKELPGSNYGVFGIGNTTLAIGGKGYVVDFSSSKTYGPTGKPVAWKGVTLMQGDSKGSPSGTVVSNIGYLQASYSFSNGTIESSGLTANFQNSSFFEFGATQPYGYLISFNNASVSVASSLVSGGNIPQAKVILPNTAIRQADNSDVVLTDVNLSIKSNMDLIGYTTTKQDLGLYWGDLIAAGGGDRKSFGVEKIGRLAYLFFSAQALPAFNPTSANGKQFFVSFTTLNPTVVETNKMQGASFSSFEILVVNSENVQNPLSPNNIKKPFNNNPIWFQLNKKDFTWMNVVTEGVHCSVVGDILESLPLKLGDPAKPLYVGVTAFNTVNSVPANNMQASPFSRIVLRCVESAVITCDFRSFLKLPEPVGDTFAFKEMVFTSTANNAGGKLALKPGDSLSYWGLDLKQKPGFSNAGLVSVKTGQIILNAAGLGETRHFKEPFWLTWGEMLANGSMGRLFFDFNSAGQQFDKFNYIHNAVALSGIDPDPDKKGFLRVGGTAFFPFFGSNYLHIVDTYVPLITGDPFNRRSITLSTSTGGGFFPTDFNVSGNWSDGLGIFDFVIKYATASQDGFLGDGMSAVRYLSGGNIPSTLDMNSRGTCIRIGSNLMDQRSISMGPVANISNITRVWGCVCLKGDGIENMVVGGEVTNAANISIAARTGTYLSAILQITPSLARLTVDGEAYMSIMASLDAVVNGHMQLTYNHAEGFVEGEVMGNIRVAQGVVFVGSSLEAEGQLNWHLGTDFNELQGMVAIKIMGTGGGSGVGAGFYAGINAPKGRAWVLLNKDPRYKLNMAPMPDRLTGVYGYVHVHQGVNLYIVSGGYDLYIGAGAFMNTSTMTPYMVGNLGGRIYGEILGGLVSAAASFNLQMILGFPFGFQGTVGLEACVVWVICGSVDLTIGLNTTEGFYIR